MKRLFALTLLLLAGHARAFGQTEMVAAATHNLAPEQQIRRAESALWRAYSAHDTAAIEQLLADDLSFTKENGYVSGKARELCVQTLLRKARGDEASGHLGPDAADLAYQVHSVRLYGQTAITTSSFDERDEGGALRYHLTNTWVKRNSAWQVVAIQITAVSDAVLDNIDKMTKR